MNIPNVPYGFFDSASAWSAMLECDCSIRVDFCYCVRTFTQASSMLIGLVLEHLDTVSFLMFLRCALRVLLLHHQPGAGLRAEPRRERRQPVPRRRHRPLPERGDDLTRHAVLTLGATKFALPASSRAQKGGEKGERSSGDSAERNCI